MKAITLRPNELGENIYTGFAPLHSVNATDLKHGDFLLIKKRPESWADGYTEISALNLQAIQNKFENEYVLNSEYFYVQIYDVHYFGGYYAVKCQNAVEISIRRDISVITVDVTCFPSKSAVAIAKCLSEIQLSL